MSADCIACIIKNHQQALHGLPGSELMKADQMLDVVAMLAREGRRISPQRAFYLIDQMQIERFQIGEDMSALKRRYNRHVMDLLPRIREAVLSASDPLMSAICHAQAGNYIDFATVQVSDEELFALLERAASQALPEAAYRAFARDLEGASTLLYLLDNAGEIVLDRLLIELLRQRYPALQITAMVRGARVMNDCTLEDAEQVGLTDIVPVVTNGTPFAGTELDHMPEQARRAVLDADVILSKGQGNFETLFGAGLNAWYLFLCKCNWFVSRFQVSPNTPMFVHERDVPISPHLMEEEAE